MLPSRGRSTRPIDYCEQRANRTIGNLSESADYPLRVNPGQERPALRFTSIASALRVIDLWEDRAVLSLARPDLLRPRWLVAGVIATLGGVLLAAPPVSAATAASSRVDLRVLVVSAGDPGSQAIATELDREGIPYTQVNVTTAGRPTI